MKVINAVISLLLFQCEARTAAREGLLASRDVPVAKAVPAVVPKVLVASAGQGLKVNATGQGQGRLASTADSEAAMQALTRATAASTSSLVRFLTGASLPPFDQYLPACLAHVERVVQSIDSSYSDVQIETVLNNECGLEKEFPNAHSDGFKNEDSCRHFAKLLADARHIELGTDSKMAYEGFCAEYYAHKKGKEVKKAAPEEEPKKKKRSQGTMFMITAALAILLIIAAVIFVMKRGSA